MVTHTISDLTRLSAREILTNIVRLSGIDRLSVTLTFRRPEDYAAFIGAAEPFGSIEEVEAFFMGDDNTDRSHSLGSFIERKLEQFGYHPDVHYRQDSVTFSFTQTVA